MAITLTSQDNIQIDYPLIDEYFYSIREEKKRNIIDLNADEIYLLSAKDLIYTFDDALQLKENSFDKKIILNNLLANFYNVIDESKIYFLEQNIELPNEISINNLERLLIKLISYNIYSFNVSISVEEGICLTFKNNNQRLHFEIYNDGDLGYIIEDYVSKNILKNKDVDNLDNAVISIVNFENNEIS